MTTPNPLQVRVVQDDTRDPEVPQDVFVVNDAEADTDLLVSALLERVFSRTPFGALEVAELTATAAWEFPYNVNSDLVDSVTSGTAGVTHSSERLAVMTASDANSFARMSTKRVLRYMPGQGGIVRFTALFTVGAVASQQIIGLGDTNDGLFFGYQGEDFGILRRTNGTDRWVFKAEWSEAANVDIDDILDTTVGNVYSIHYQWLGFGAIEFFIEEPSTGNQILVHRIAYANRNTEPTIYNPTLPLMAEARNFENASPIVVKTASAVAAIAGKSFGPEPIHPLTLFRSVSATRSGITTQIAVVTIRNNTTFAGITNRARVRIAAASIYAEGSGTNPITIRGVKNTTLGGSPSYTNYNANTSAIAYDTAGTTLTGGTIEFEVKIGRNTGVTLDLEDYGIELGPGEILTISAQTTLSVAIETSIRCAELI